jgi:formylglycine-generating enzyme required for sulfatase activity
MGVSDRVPLQLPLLDLYIPLNARVGTPEGETWAREPKVAGWREREYEVEAIVWRMSASQAVLNLLDKHAGLIVLGDPGAGKTTLLKFLALSLATGQGEALGLGIRLPVLLPLSAYANALKPGEADIPLQRFIDDYYRHRGVELSIDTLLRESLEQGRTLLLLDGLDEVKDPGQRRRVVDLITDFFTVHRKAGNKFVLTSRIVGYPEVRPRVEGLAECTLADLEDEEIEAFVDKWTAALERAALGQGRVAAFEAEREREELLSAVHRNPGVRALAVNPLLLTVLALMKRQGITLPERRVELYQNYVETLLKHWNLARSLAGRIGRDLDVVETVRILAPLALWMHRTSPGVGLVPKAGLQRELEQIYRARGHADPERAARDFLDDVREHTSLLLDRGGNQFGFIHLTFQEYLAGVTLAQRGQQDIGPIVQELAAHIGDDTWHEVSLLAIGYLGIVQQRDEAAGAVLEALVRQAPGEPPGQAVVLAGEAVVDAGSGGVTPAAREQVAQALLATLRDDEHVKASRRRAEAGRVLAACGDPRPEVMSLDGMEFCLISAGPFLMGNTYTDEEAHDDEMPQAEYDIPYDYWIGRYPVTVAQYREYVQASGNAPEGARALIGPVNHPVAWVSWPEAIAFCEWLTQRWREQGRLTEGWAVLLPSEPEWEKATRGGLQVPTRPVTGRPSGLPAPTRLRANPKPKRRYPWGDHPDANRANYDQTGIGETSAVGCFPEGASLYGCEEMSGNVWEWTRSLWGPYPYSEERERRKRENPARHDRRVLRGGAFLRQLFTIT